jgi:aryl-alcohol dehydrogenase-like predicted oxidoreductase
VKSRVIANCGLEISEIGLGTMTWGRDTDEYEAREQFDLFVQDGGTYIDTADVYSDGNSEKLLGQFIAENDLINRQDLVIATKGGRIRNAERSINNTHIYLSKALDSSLERLNLDFVDIYFLHAHDIQTPLDAVAENVLHILDSNKARYVAVSNFSAWQITYLSEKISSSRFIGTQNEYSLIKRDPESEIFNALAHLKLGFFAWSPLGRGVLTGKYRNSIPADSRAASPHLGQFVRSMLTDSNQKNVEALSTAASGLGCTSLELALLWVLQNPGVTSAITGARNAAQLRTILHALNSELPEQIYAALNEVSQNH